MMKKILFLGFVCLSWVFLGCNSERNKDSRSDMLQDSALMMGKDSLYLDSPIRDTLSLDSQISSKPSRN